MTQRLEEEVANAELLPNNEQVPPLEENVNGNQAPANPSPMTEAVMRSILAQIAQAINTESQATSVQAQFMTAKANRDIAPPPHQQVTTRASNLRESSRMNPSTFYGSKVYKDPQEFIVRYTRYYIIWWCR